MCKDELSTSARLFQGKVRNPLHNRDKHRYNLESGTPLVLSKQQKLNLKSKLCIGKLTVRLIRLVLKLNVSFQHFRGLICPNPHLQ